MCTKLYDKFVKWLSFGCAPYGCDCLATDAPHTFPANNLSSKCVDLAQRNVTTSSLGMQIFAASHCVRTPMWLFRSRFGYVRDTLREQSWNGCRPTLISSAERHLRIYHTLRMEYNQSQLQSVSFYSSNKEVWWNSRGNCVDAGDLVDLPFLFWECHWQRASEMIK